MRNPFTGKTTTITTSEPEWTDEPEPIAPPQMTVVAIQGDYGDYLESRLPAFVRARAHWATKGLTELELGPLLKSAGLPPMEVALYAPPSRSAILRALPAGFAAVAADDAGRLASLWAAEMSRPEHTHTAAGRRVKPDWTDADAMETLRPMVALAQQAGATDQVFLLTEW
jgi:hypothetical protein